VVDLVSDLTERELINVRRKRLIDGHVILLASCALVAVVLISTSWLVKKPAWVNITLLSVGTSLVATVVFSTLDNAFNRGRFEALVSTHSNRVMAALQSLELEMSGKHSGP
jgi:hypothetical protein